MLKQNVGERDKNLQRFWVFFRVFFDKQMKLSSGSTLKMMFLQSRNTFVSEFEYDQEMK